MLPDVIDEFLEAVAARDAARLARCFTADATYHLIVPQPPLTGRDAIESVFARILGEVTRTQWDVVSSAVSGDLVFLERVDRFWFGEREAAMECLGVFELAQGKIAAVRDYADHETWTVRRHEATKA